MVEAAVSTEDIARARFWLTEFAKDWVGEIPTKIHKKEYGGLGTPEFSDEFVGYIGELTCNVPTCMICIDRKQAPKHSLTSEGYRLAHRVPTRNRVTKAFRKLRRVAPVEFDVLYMIVMLGLNVSEVAKRLTDRSYERGFNEIYDTSSVTILVVSGIEKVQGWY